MGGFDGGGADEPVSAAPVPRLEELLARVLPGARDEQLEPDRSMVRNGLAFDVIGAILIVIGVPVMISVLGVGG
jgi:hypothetical protein